VPCIIEVHMRLRRAVHQHEPPARPVRVGDQLDGTLVSGASHGWTTAVALPVSHRTIIVA
jgi:hypothetical protein